jgi:hypothetical protein
MTTNLVSRESVWAISRRSSFPPAQYFDLSSLSKRVPYPRYLSNHIKTCCSEQLSNAAALI